MFYTHCNEQQNFGKVVPRMGIYSLNKLCKCNFHRTQHAIFTRRKLKKRNNSLKAGDLFALALRKQARYLEIYGAGLFCSLPQTKGQTISKVSVCLILYFG